MLLKKCPFEFFSTEKVSRKANFTAETKHKHYVGILEK